MLHKLFNAGMIALLAAALVAPMFTPVLAQTPTPDNIVVKVSNGSTCVTVGPFEGGSVTISRPHQIDQAIPFTGDLKTNCQYAKATKVVYELNGAKYVLSWNGLYWNKTEGLVLFIKDSEYTVPKQ